MSETQDLEALGFVKKTAPIILDSLFTKSVFGGDFQHHQFHNTGAKNLSFESCNFSYCTFDRAYFHGCTFVKCKFLGARFVDCNFRNATFDNCDFEYALFSSTLISYMEVLKNLPAWPNVKRELLRGLRINAERTGDVEAVKVCVREELAASREHLRLARQGKDKYYVNKYGSPRKKVAIYWESFWNWLDWNLWGHGEYPWKLLRTMFLVLFVATMFLVLTDVGANANASVMAVWALGVQRFADVFNTFIGVIPTGFPIGLAAILALFRYIIMGLFITVLYKRIVRR